MGPQASPNAVATLARVLPAAVAAGEAGLGLLLPLAANLVAVPALTAQHLAEMGRVQVDVGPPPQRETPPLPPLPPSADQVAEQVKRVLPPSVSAPDIQTSTPPMSSEQQPLPLPIIDWWLIPSPDLTRSRFSALKKSSGLVSEIDRLYFAGRLLTRLALQGFIAFLCVFSVACSDLFTRLALWRVRNRRR
jgi:hypothetical protein